MEERVLLRAEKICKSFPGVKALSDVSFDLYAGEVHVLMGENGAGKSTLMKIFSGLYSTDSGQIYVEGKPVTIHNIQESQKLGIAIIYQEFNLVPDLTVANNIFLNREPRNKYGNIDYKKMNSDADHYLKMIRANIKPDDSVRRLGVAQQQLVEIAKALSQKAKILIMDEPTAALSDNEIVMLFEIIRELKKTNVGIIYISHRLQELNVIGDRVTVLRDGHTISTDKKEDVQIDEIIRRMVGRKVSNERVRDVNSGQSGIMLDIRNISRKGILNDVSLQVHKGEIVALAGLVGAGRTELAHAVFGIDKIDMGEVFIDGKRIKNLSPKVCISNGLGLLPESRKENGLTLSLPIKQNITSANLRSISKFGRMNLAKERTVSEDYIKLLKISCTGIAQMPLYLSGGNQQKVVIGKWLYSNPRVLIFDEPTRGIDVGAKNEIYQLMNRLAKEGMSILMISSDLLEIMTIADRIYVMREGRIVKEMDIAEASQEKITAYAVGEGDRD